MRSILTKKILLTVCSWLLLLNIIVAQSAENTALDYLQSNLSKLNLTENDVRNYRVSDEVYTKHNGVTSIYLIQQHQQTDVFEAMINVNILPNGEILSMGNKFISNLAEKINNTQPQISMEAAVTAVQQNFNIQTYVPLLLKNRISDKEATFENEGIALEPIKVKLIYQPMENGLVRLAWNVEIYELSAQNYWNTRVDAMTGEILDFHNQVIHCNFGTSADHCAENHPHHLPLVQSKASTTLAPPPVSNVYNVYPIPLTSPDHGDQALVANPANFVASPFGWHDTDGQPGHEFTITRGNNVHAYHDIFDLNSSIGDEPDGGDSLVFDLVYDENITTPYVQVDAATINLFFWNNVMHDLWYQYGFDEASGNFQENNYGNGGIGNDYVRAEALDGSGENNANFFTPTDGSRPRMQMYFWGGSAPNPNQGNFLEVTNPDSLVGQYDMEPAQFGSPLPPADEAIISQVVLVDDGIGVVTDGCDDILNGSEIAGKIAMIDRGNCQFGTKVLKAEQLGAIAVIICNQMPGSAVSMPPGVDGGAVTIPSVMVSLDDCNTIKMGLPDLEVRLFASAMELPNPGPVGKDSDLDNGIIAHEYGHGISTRLTGGPNTGCLNSDEQAGEGWSDFFGLAMQTTADNFAEQGRGIGTYVQNQPTGGGGIRTYRYSRDMSINPDTYANLPSNFQVHRVGSIWCVMIWDLYWNLVDKYGFDEDLYNGTGGNNIAMQLVMDGMKFQPCNPNFLDSRDAIIAADIANNNGENVCLIWDTFARRGLGFSAQAGGFEAFDRPPLCFDGIRVFKTADAEADAEGLLTYSLLIINGTTEDLPDAVVTDILPQGVTYVEGSLSCGGSVDNGVISIPFPNLVSESVITCTYQVQIANEPFTYVDFADSFEATSGNWVKSNDGIGQNWSLSVSNPFLGSFSIAAQAPASMGEQYFTLEEPILLEDDNPAVSFYHIYRTEENFDGGVVEISTDGENWLDAAPYFVKNGYNGMISANANSALAGRPAFTGNSGFDYTQSIIDLSEFAGEAIQIRFRLATDDENEGEGWKVDNVEIFGNFYSITNTACIVDGAGEELCSDATTIVRGEKPTATIAPVLDNSITLFPNPTEQQFFLKFENQSAEAVQVTIRSIDGRVLLVQQRNTADTAPIDVSSFVSGVYIVELQMERGTINKKLMING